MSRKVVDPPRVLAATELSASLARAGSQDELKRAYLEAMAAFCPEDRLSVWLLQDHRLVPMRSSTGLTVRSLCPAGDSTVARALRERRVLAVGGPGAIDAVTSLYEGFTGRSELAVPMASGGEILGVVDLQRDAMEGYGEHEVSGAAVLTYQFAAELHGMRQRDELTRSMREVITTLSEMVEAKDDYTEGHCQRIAEMSLGVGIRLGLSEARLDDLTYAALLHDIGKMAIPDAILQKPARLTEEEFALVKTHPTVGRRVLERVRFLRPVAHIVEQHHEAFDGSGYPKGLIGEDISREARIISVADAFDAMTSTRPYRKALGRHVALGRLSDGAGTQFDPEVVEIFVSFMGGSDGR